MGSTEGGALGGIWAAQAAIPAQSVPDQADERPTSSLSSSAAVVRTTLGRAGGVARNWQSAEQ